MTIKVKLNSRGSAALTLTVISTVLGALGVYQFYSQAKMASRLHDKNKKEAFQLVTAHTFAALLKQELSDGLRAIQASNPNCVSGPDPVVAFLALLNATSGACASTAFSPTHFRFQSGSSLPLSQLKSAKWIPKSQYAGSFQSWLQITEVNETRSRISGQILLENQSTNGVQRGLLSSRLVEFQIDATRTLNNLVPDSSCHICRTAPGSVCCGSYSRYLEFTFLESGSARIMEASYDKVTKILSVSQVVGETRNKIAVSAKNVGSPTTFYRADSFKVPGVDPANPARYIIDTAQDDSGIDYFLSDHGEIILANGSRVSSDPKIQSIAYSETLWLLLRADGAVLSAPSLSNPSQYKDTGVVIKNAEKLTAGRGTTDTF